MIRQDWILRMIREMAQVLARMATHRERSDYAQALEELDEFLSKHGALTEPPDVEGWIQLGLGEDRLEKLEKLGDLWRERGELLNLEQRALAAHHSYTVALGLYLERVNNGPVGQTLLDRVGECLAETDDGPLPGPVLTRLAAYYEARGWFGRAEDVFFEWLETGDQQAAKAGLAFYQRLRSVGAAQLKAGNLSREEVEQGEAEFRERSRG